MGSHLQINEDRNPLTLLPTTLVPTCLEKLRDESKENPPMGLHLNNPKYLKIHIIKLPNDPVKGIDGRVKCKGG